MKGRFFAVQICRVRTVPKKLGKKATRVTSLNKIARFNSACCIFAISASVHFFSLDNSNVRKIKEEDDKFKCFVTFPFYDIHIYIYIYIRYKIRNFYFHFKNNTAGISFDVRLKFGKNCNYRETIISSIFSFAMSDERVRVRFTNKTVKITND